MSLLKCNYDLFIIGLGNPETKYENTRHNIGFCAVDALAREYSAVIDKSKFNALTADIKADGKRILFMKPLTYMNLSGEAVSAAMRFYKISADRILVLCDDIYQDVGCIRIRNNGSDGGHNGLKNIAACIGTSDYKRIRIGVGKKPAEYDMADWVLSSFSSSEREILDTTLKNVVSASKLIIDGKTDIAMNRYNTRGGNK